MTFESRTEHFLPLMPKATNTAAQIMTVNMCKYKCECSLHLLDLNKLRLHELVLH